MTALEELQNKYTKLCAEVGDKVYKILIDIEQIKILNNQANEIAKAEKDQNVTNS
jgi:hypothetical protein